MALVYLAIGIFIGWRYGQVSWKHLLVMIFLAFIWANPVAKAQGGGFLGMFVMAGLVQLVGYAIGIFIANRRRPEE